MNAGTGTGAHLDPLPEEECWELLARVPVGRVAISIEGEAPLVLPVTHVVEERSIVFRSGDGSKLDALQDAPISFEVDDIDPFHRTGWSVLVRGVAVLDGVAATDDEPVPWAGGEGRHQRVRIWPTHVSGRRIVAGALDWQPQGYL